MLFKKYPALNELAIEENWAVYQGHLNDSQIFLRINRWCDSICGHPELRFRVGIAIPFTKEQPSGLPTSEQMVILGQIEDSIADIAEKDRKTVLAICITGVGFKEYVLYTAEPEKIDDYLKEIRKLYPEYEFQHYIEEDKKWDGYKYFSKK